MRPRDIIAALDARDHGTVKAWLSQASWGQHGCLFVTDRRHGWGTSRVRGLHVNGRLRASIIVDLFGEVSLWEILSADEAEERYQEEKAARRERAAQMREDRERLSEALAFGRPERHEWRYIEGQEGGYFVPSEAPWSSGRRVPAPGVLRRVEELKSEALASEVDRACFGARW